jgi:hypothetical protein
VLFACGEENLDEGLQSMTTLALRALIVSCSLGLSPFGVAAQQTPESKPPTILLSVHAENEGPNGLWVQAGKDLSATEVDTFQQLLENSLTAMKDIRLVEVEDKRDHVEVIVSLTKVRRGNGTWWYAASSVIGLAKSKTDEFVTHNCIVGEDLQTIAKAIGFSFASIRLRIALGALSN